MASNLEQVTFKFRRGTSQEWTIQNPILAQGEPGYETDTGLLKVGNGSSTWTSLGYFTDMLNTNGSISIGQNSGLSNQGDFAVAIGGNVGIYSQGDYAVAIGHASGQTGQGQDSVAIGRLAGQTNQGYDSIAIGRMAGRTNQPNNSIVLNASGMEINSSASNSFVVKPIRVDYTQTTPLCYNSTSGEIVQGIDQLDSTEVAIGYKAGETGQSNGSIAIGQYAGNSSQELLSIALGVRAGQLNQGSNSIAIGYLAGNNNQPDNSIVLNSAGYALNPTTPNAFYVKPIRTDVTQTTPLCYNSTSGEIVVGGQSILQGNTGPTGTSYNMNASEIAIGLLAASSNQGTNGIAIGQKSGKITQGTNSVAIGISSGEFNQGAKSISIGPSSGASNQGTESIAIGDSAGFTGQGSGSIALGWYAGFTGQGSKSIALGYKAGNNNQPENSIILNATGTEVNGSTANAFYVKPIRTDLTQTSPLCYNSTSGEIIVGNLKQYSGHYWLENDYPLENLTAFGYTGSEPSNDINYVSYDGNTGEFTVIVPGIYMLHSTVRATIPSYVSMPSNVTAELFITIFVDNSTQRNMTTEAFPYPGYTFTSQCSGHIRLITGSRFRCGLQYLSPPPAGITGTYAIARGGQTFGTSFSWQYIKSA